MKANCSKFSSSKKMAEKGMKLDSVTSAVGSMDIGNNSLGKDFSKSSFATSEFGHNLRKYQGEQEKGDVVSDAVEGIMGNTGGVGKALSAVANTGLSEQFMDSNTGTVKSDFGNQLGYAVTSGLDWSNKFNETAYNLEAMFKDNDFNAFLDQATLGLLGESARDKQLKKDYALHKQDMFGKQASYNATMGAINANAAPKYQSQLYGRNGLKLKKFSKFAKPR